MYSEHHRKEKQRLASQRYREKQPKALPPIVPIPDVSISKLAWAAGLFEGEGTIGISGGGKRPYTRMFVSLTSTDFEVVKFFIDRWPGQLTETKSIKNTNARPFWTWRLSCRKAEVFLNQLLPFIRTRRVRDKIVLALKVQSTRTRGTKNNSEGYRAMQNEFKREMQVLNRRGRIS